MTQYIEDFLPPIQDAGLNTLENVNIAGTLVAGATNVGGTLITVLGTTVYGISAVPTSATAVATGKPLTLFANGPSFYVTSDVPSFTAVKGSICINTGGTTTNNRLYINTDSGTTWTAITTAA